MSWYVGGPLEGQRIDYRIPYPAGYRDSHALSWDGETVHLRLFTGISERDVLTYIFNWMKKMRECHDSQEVTNG